MIGLVLTMILLQLPTLPPNPNAKTLNMVCALKQGTYDCRRLEEAMVAPRVEHEQKQHTETYDEVTRSCPDGYEGHFVDPGVGFDWSIYTRDGYQGWYDTLGAPPGYTICFKKEFMDGIRSNPELLAPRPSPPKGI